MKILKYVFFYGIIKQGCKSSGKQFLSSRFFNLETVWGVKVLPLNSAISAGSIGILDTVYEFI